MRQLVCQRLSQEAFANFGSVIDAARAPVEVINDGSTRRHSDLASLDLRAPASDPVISLYEASARVFPLRLLKLERHGQASQVFIPLSLHCFIVVVAPGAAEPDWHGITAFISARGQGISLHRGCWHHGLIVLGEGDRFAVIEGGEYRRDTLEVDAPEEIELIGPA